MYYFSELYRRKVETEGGYYVGRLVDIVFLQEDTPKITRILVQNGQKNILSIPLSAVRKINHEITINKSFNFSPALPNEITIAKHLLDKQIIDLIGNKIVRVNDVLIQNNPFFYVSGIDISLRGIARRLGVCFIPDFLNNFFKLNLALKLLSWGDIQNLELATGFVKLRKREEKLSRLRTEDLADYLEKTNIKNAGKFLKSFDDKKAAEIIADLNLNYQSALFMDFKPETASKFLSLIDPDEAVDVLYALPFKRREQIISLLSEEKRQELEYLMSFTTTPVGNLMTSQYLAVSSNQTAKDVIGKIKRDTVDYSFLAAIYVLNDEKQLVGVFSPHELLLQNPETPVFKFMIQNPIVAHLSTPVEIIVKKLLKYRISSIPIVGKNKKMLGIVTIDDISDFVLNHVGWL